MWVGELVMATAKLGEPTLRGTVILFVTCFGIALAMVTVAVVSERGVVELTCVLTGGASLLFAGVVAVAMWLQARRSAVASRPSA